MSVRATSLHFIQPMSPTLVAEPPAGGGWLHEIKHDGFRTQIIIQGGVARAFSRNGLDWTSEYGPIVDAAGRLGCDTAILDGEVAVQDERGLTDFGALRSAMKHASHRLIFFAFDLLHLDGEDLRNRPIEARRASLEELLASAPSPHLQFSEAIELEGVDVFKSAEQLGCEGIVSKRKGSLYSARRSTAWLKTKAYTTGTFEVIGVDVTPGGAPVALLAVGGEDGRIYAGNAFIGLPGKLRDPFWRLVEQRTAEQSPIRGMRRKSTTWLKPGLLAEVKYLRGEGLLRHASIVAASLGGRP